jgi:chromosome segregation ATPase
MLNNVPPRYLEAIVAAEDEAAERPKERDSSRGEEPVGDLVDFLLDNPWVHQALQLALGARERASQAGAQAMRNVGVPTAADLDRLARRVRALSERLESVEDKLDALSDEMTELRRLLRAPTKPRP